MFVLAKEGSDKLLEAMNANINYFDSLASIGLRADSSQVLYRIEYINFVLNKGLHIDIVAQLIGHKNLQTTLIYVRQQKPLLKDLKIKFEKS